MPRIRALITLCLLLSQPERLGAQGSARAGTLQLRVPERVGGFRIARRIPDPTVFSNLALTYRRYPEDPAYPSVTVGVFPHGASSTCPTPCSQPRLDSLATRVLLDLLRRPEQGAWDSLSVTDTLPFRVPFDRPRFPARHTVMQVIRDARVSTLHLYWTALPEALITVRVLFPGEHRWDQDLDQFVAAVSAEIAARLGVPPQVP